MRCASVFWKMPRYTTSMETLRSSAIATSKQLQDPFADRADVLSGRGACRFGVAARERVEDAPVRVERCVCSLVRLEPLLARCSEHVPHDREHRGEELVLRRIADDLVEARVLFRVCLAGGDPPLLRGEYFAQLGELRITDARRGKRCKRGLDQTAELDDVGNAVAAGDEAVERPREIIGRDLANERAAASARFDHSEQLEGPQRSALTGTSTQL